MLVWINKLCFRTLAVISLTLKLAIESLGLLLDCGYTLAVKIGIPLRFLDDAELRHKRAMIICFTLALATLYGVFVTTTFFPHAFVLWVTMSVALITYLKSTHSAGIQAKKQNTINLLFQTREQEVYQAHIGQLQTSKTWIDNDEISAAFYNKTKELAGGEDGNLSDLQKNDIKTYQAIKYLLNFYEFLSAGLCNGHLDEELLYITVRPFLVNLAYKTAPIIRYYRTGNEHAKSDADIVSIASDPDAEAKAEAGSVTPQSEYARSKSLCNFIYVFNRWNHEVEPSEQPYLGPEPDEAVLKSRPDMDSISLSLFLKEQDMRDYTLTGNWKTIVEELKVQCRTRIE